MALGTLATIGLIMAGTGSLATAGTSIYNATKTPNKPDIELPKSPVATDSVSPVKAAETSQAAIDQKKRAMARSKSIYTSPLGIGADASIARKTLLGQ